MKFAESPRLELKREYTADIVKSVIAFANTAGGTIYIGVDDDGGVVGITDIDGTMLRITNAIRDSVNPDVTLFISYATETISGKEIIKITVQQGTAAPYYLSGKGIRPEGVYVRQGTSTVSATEAAILSMIKATGGERYENMRSLNQTLTFVEAEQEFSRRGVAFGEQQMRSLGLIDESGTYTNLGLLLSDQCTHSIKLAVFEGDAKGTFKDRREFFGSLLKQLNDCYDFIDRYNSISSTIEGLHRTDRRDYPTDAVRETLLNALVHRDYSFSGSTLISIFGDRIEFVSIGGLVKGLLYDDIMLGVSIARNENLAAIFYRLRLIEAYGTGMPKIIKSYNDYHKKPIIETSPNAFKITLFNSSVDDDKDALTENEFAVIALFADKTVIVRRDIEEILACSQAMAIRLLRSLCDKKQIKAKGGGKNTTYVKS